MTAYATTDPITFGIWDATADTPGVRVCRKTSLWDTWVRFPPQRARVAPAVQRQTQDLLIWTDWSARFLAEILGTTHPTVSAIAAGRSSTFTRVPELPARISGLHGLLERLFVVAGKDVIELNRLLGTSSEGEPTALDRLGDWDLTGAWLAAIDVASPRRRSGMMRGRFAARVGEATTSLHE